MNADVSAHQTTVLTVEALTAFWAIPNPAQIPAVSPGLILPPLWASSDETTDDHKDETEKVKVYGPVSSPGPWLCGGIVDSLRSDQFSKRLTKGEQSRYERLRLAELRRAGSLYLLQGLTQVEIVKKIGLSLKEISEQMARVREIGAAK